MQGKKIEQAREALKFCVNSLNSRDRFNIIKFNTGIEKFKNKPVYFSRASSREAMEFIKGIEANGGTNIDMALGEALKMLRGDKEAGTILFLTDGLATVGETNPASILDNVKESNSNDVRMFIFGVGYDVDIHFLDKLSLQNHALSTYVRPQKDIEVKVSSLYTKISHPVLQDIKLNFGRISNFDVYPIELPDLFKGSQLLVLGRYKGSGKSSVRLSGIIQGQEKVFGFRENFPKNNLANDFLPRLWAARKIGYLLDEIRLNGEKKELVDEIVALSKKYGIITEYTSFLIDEDMETPLEELTVRADKKMQEAFGVNVGSWAVSQAQNAQNLKRQAQVPTNVIITPEGKTERVTRVKYVGGKAFYYQNGVWVNAEYMKGQKEEIIKNFSEEYFKLNRKSPLIAQYQALGREIIVNIEGRNIHFK